ncbi:MAG: Lin0368 family putative glycerol transporter subunit [Bacillota bacterium]
MSIYGVVTTLVGAFTFPFLICMCWGKLVEKMGPAGGWIAAGFIVGTMWTINHALPGVGFGTSQTVVNNLIVQGANAPWVDMAWAAGTGVFVNGIYNGGKVSKAMPTLICVLLGGICGGIVLGIIGK